MIHLLKLLSIFAAATRVWAHALYLRPVAILVRPGNPKGIRGFRDLLAPGVKVLTAKWGWDAR